MYTLAVIENNNNADLLIPTLNKLKEIKDLSILVIDNYSTDSSWNILKQNIKLEDYENNEEFGGFFGETCIKCHRTQKGRNVIFKYLDNFNVFWFSKTGYSIIDKDMILKEFEDERVGIVYGNSRKNGIPQIFKSFDKIELCNNNIFPNSLFIKMEVLKECGQFSDTFHKYWIKATDKFVAVHIPEFITDEISA